MGRLARFDKCTMCNSEGSFSWEEVLYYYPKIKSVIKETNISLTFQESIIYSLHQERVDELNEKDHPEWMFTFIPQSFCDAMVDKRGLEIHQYEVIAAICGLMEKGIINTRIIHGKLDMLDTGFLHVVLEIECLFFYF